MRDLKSNWNLSKHNKPTRGDEVTASIQREPIDQKMSKKIRKTARTDHFAKRDICDEETLILPSLCSSYNFRSDGEAPTSNAVTLIRRDGRTDSPKNKAEFQIAIENTWNIDHTQLSRSIQLSSSSVLPSSPTVLISIKIHVKILTRLLLSSVSYFDFDSRIQFRMLSIVLSFAKRPIEGK